jgi:hypothetical protein
MGKVLICMGKQDIRPKFWKKELEIQYVGGIYKENRQ